MSYDLLFGLGRVADSESGFRVPQMNDNAWMEDSINPHMQPEITGKKSVPVGPLIIDSAKMASMRTQKPWLKNPKYFTKVRINTPAAIKMLQHSLEGIERGLGSANGMPLEVMGLLRGTIDASNDRTLVILDAYPVAAEGTETQVMTDNPEVVNHLIELSETVEQIHGEPMLIGWYHSHPFAVQSFSNAFLSSTDVGTQNAWQMPEDQAGNPWVALVVDPLRSMQLGKPDIGSFRCYPVSSSVNVAPDLAPDGEVVQDVAARNARWGEASSSYYQLETEYVMSQHASDLIKTLSRELTWVSALASLSEKTNAPKQSGVNDMLQHVNKLLSSHIAESHSMSLSYSLKKPSSVHLREASSLVEKADAILQREADVKEITSSLFQ
jgi:COP9 signalosome complex subunit 5